MNTICKLLPFAVAASALASNTFFFNEAGYDAEKPISIIVQSTSELEGTKWTLFYAPDDTGLTGATVMSGTFGKGENPDNWAKSGKYYTINLGSRLLAYSGKFYVGLTAGSPSTSGYFVIKENALAETTLGMVLDYFYDDRANNAAILKMDENLPVFESSSITRDVRGGWYDASGDVSKYLSHLSYANYLNPQQIPLTVWVLAHTAERIPTLLASTSTKAKTANEAAYGADFLVRMLDEQGFFYMTVFDNWGSLSGKRELCAFSGEDGIKSADYQTAFREGGGMAIAALARMSTLKVNGDFTSEQYLAAAEKAYAHLSEKQGIGKACTYCDDGKENIIDDYTALLAATELYAATSKDQYLLDANKRVESLTGRLSEDGYFWSDDAKTRPFWHASDAGLPLIALLRYAEIQTIHCLGGVCYEQILLTHIKKHYDWLLSITNKVENPFGYARQTYKTGGAIKDGFFIPHDNESGYWWQGEDARIASLAAAVTYTAHAMKNIDGYDGGDKYATDQLDWILGKNPYGTCMMNGIGNKNPEVYNGQSAYDATLKGGIANGITGRNEDGSGIAWDDDGVAYVGFDPIKTWNNWRWIEQWLPHSTWYLMALATRYDENPIVIDVSGNAIPKSSIAKAQSFDVHLQGKSIEVIVSGLRDAKTVAVIGLDGRTIAKATLNKGQATLDLNNAQSGIYLVKVNNLGAQKIVIK